MSSVSETLIVFLLLALYCVASQAGAATTADAAEPQGVKPLRVCADPNNLPYSNEREEGFENVLASMVADELGQPLTYVWWPQRRGFIRKTLKAEKCDLVMGVPAHFEMAAVTEPYYRSSFVFVTRAKDGLNISSFDDPRLRTLQIGVHLVGDDYSNPPPAMALAVRDIRDNVHGYSIYGDYSTPAPTRNLIDAVARGEIDVAVAWGPQAGYFAAKADEPLRVTPLDLAASENPEPMAFSIAMGVRHGDEELKRRVEKVLRARSREIGNVLRHYHVPLLEPADAEHSRTAGRKP